MRRFLTSARAMLPRLFPFLLPLGLVAQEQACLPYDKSVNPASAAVELTVTEPTGITLETIRLTGDINVRWQFDIVAGNQATLTGAESLGAPTPINHVFDIDDCRLPPGDYVLLLRRTAGSSYFVSGNWRGGGTGNGLSAYARTMWSNTNFEGPGAPAGVGPCLRYSLGALPCDLALDSRSLAGDALSGGIEVTTATGTTIVTGATTQQWPAGTAVTLTAPLEVSGAVFANWEVDGVDLAPGEQRLDLTLFRDRQVVAEYRTLHLLTVQATQDGTSIQSAVSASPADRNGLTGGTATFALDYEWGTAVTLTAPELFANRGMFRRWLVDDVAQPLWANELTVTIDDDRTVVAEYTGVECFEWDMGPGLGMTDNSLSVGHALGFDFPLPGGGLTDRIDISSNGFLWLVSGSSTNPSPLWGWDGLVQDPPRVCALWKDLSVATAGGDVHFKSFGDHAVVTWRRVSLGGSERCTAQCTLYPNGRVVFAHAGALPTAPVVIGVVHGDGVDGPEIVDVSTDPDWSTTGTHGWYWVSFPGTLTPRVFTSAPTATGQAGAVLTTACMPATSEVYGSGCPTAGSFWQQGDVSDLADTSYRLTPNAAGGYTVTAAAASLDPQIGTATGIGDDALFTVNLPFAFVHPSNPAGSTAVDVCSNGYLWLDAGATTSAAYAPIASNLFAEPARLALLWTDLNPTDPLSDDVYVDVRPDRAVITWNAVVEYGRPTPLTAQCVLFADGSITWCFGSQLDAWTPAITGYSAGNGAASVAAQALAATVPFATSAEGQAPLALSTAWTPVLGESIAMTVENVPTTPALGLTLAGFLPQSVDLGSYGAPGCTILNSLEVSVATVHGASFGTVEFPIPSNPVMLGVPLYLQHAAVSPGTNALGLVVSNGLRLVVGEF